jgi:hypothetical protein
VVIRIIQISYNKTNNSDLLSTLLNTIDSNRHRAPNNYRYPNTVLRFATCFFVLASVYVYEYVRINLKFLLPSIYTIKSYYTQNPYSDAKFGFDECKTYLDSNQNQCVPRRVIPTIGSHWFRVGFLSEFDQIRRKF